MREGREKRGRVEEISLIYLEPYLRVKNDVNGRQKTKPKKMGTQEHHSRTERKKEKKRISVLEEISLMECGWQSSFTAFFTEKHILSATVEYKQTYHFLCLCLSLSVPNTVVFVLMGLSSANYSP